MAIRNLKLGRSEQNMNDDAVMVRDVVTGILADVSKRGDAAIHSYSDRFDN